MEQGWKRLPLLVVVLLFWRNADGFRGGAFNAHHRWGQPSDTFSPRAVQSSVSETHVPGILPVEEVGSNLFIRPLKSSSKLNLLQFVKGGTSSSQSTSYAQTAPSRSVSASLLRPLNERPLSSLTSTGSAVPVAASVLRFGTKYTASGSGRIVSMQGGSSSYPVKLGVSGHITSDSLPVSSSQEAPVHQSAEAPLPVSSSQEAPVHQSAEAPLPVSSSQEAPVHQSAEASLPVFSSQEAPVHLSEASLPVFSSQEAPVHQAAEASLPVFSSQEAPVHQAAEAALPVFSSQEAPVHQAAEASLPVLSSQEAPVHQAAEASLPVFSSQEAPVHQSEASLPVFSSQEAPVHQAAEASLPVFHSQEAPVLQSAEASLPVFHSQEAPVHQAAEASLPVFHSQEAPVQSAEASLPVFHSQEAPVQSAEASLPVFSSQEAPVQSAEASLPVFSYSSSSAQGGTSTFQSSPELLPESLGQPVSSQGEGSYSGLSQSASSPYASDSNTKLSSLSTGDQSSPSLYSSNSKGSYLFLGFGPSHLEEVAQLSPLVDLSSQFQETSSQPLVSSQITNGQSSPILNVVSPQSSSDLTSTDATSPLLIQGSVPYSSLSNQVQGSATSQGSLGAEMSSSVHSIPTQVGSDSYSGVPLVSSLSTQESLMSNKIDSLPLGVSSQSTSAQSSPSGSTSSTHSGYVSQLATYASVQGSGSASSLPLKPPGTQSQNVPASPIKYVGAPMSAPQATYSQSTSSGSFGAVSQIGSPSQMGVSGLTSQGGNYYSRLLPQSQATSSQHAFGYSKPISSPQSASSQTTSVLSSRKQYIPVSQGSSGAQFGGSTGFASQGMSSSYSGLVQSQGTSHFAPASSSTSVSLSPPQTVAGPTTVQGSEKQLTSTFSGTQAGSSTVFTLQGSTGYGGSPQPQDTASQFAPGSSPYTSASLSVPQAVAGPTAVQVSQKQFTSTFTGSSGAQAGSSTPLTLQGSTGYGGSPQPQDTASLIPQDVSQSSSQKQLISTSQGSSGVQFGTSTGFSSGVSSRYSGSVQSQDTASQFAPGSSPYTSVSLSAPQAGPSSTVQSSLKQFTSAFTGSSGAQAGSSTPLTLQGSTGYGGSPQPQGTAGQFAPGSSAYTSVSLSAPQVGPSSTVQSSRKQFTSTFTGSSGTQAGSSTPLTLQGSTGYGGSPQPQGTAGQFAPGSSPYTSVSLSMPQAVAGPTAVQVSQKQFTSTFTGSSGAQAGSSTPSFLQGSTGYGGSPQPQDTASQFAPGSSPYTSVSLSAPQVGPSSTVQSSRKQFTSTFTGSSGTQAGSSTPLTLQGSTGYGGSPQPQDTASQFAPGSSPYASVSLSMPQAVAGPTAVQVSQKQFTSTFTGSSGAQAGSSTPSFLQGSTGYGGSPQPQGTAGQFAPGSSPYTSVSLSAPQAGPSTTVQSSRKQFTSTFTGSSGAQAGSSTPSFLQGSTGYGGSPQPQDTASQFAPGSSPYTSVSLSAPQVGPSSTVQSSRKQFTSTFTGSSGTQAGSSTPLTLQGSTGYGGSPQPQGTAGQFAPGSSPYTSVSLSMPQAVAGPTAVQVSQKQFTSTFTGSSGAQAGSSTPSFLQGSTGYGGSPQPQDTASQFAPGSSPYTSVSLSAPQVGPSSTVQSSRKQFTSTFTGSSGTQAGSSTPLTLQGSTGYGGSPQPQDTASQFAPGSSPYASVSLSMPQAVAGPTAVQVSQKQFTSTFTGSSGAQAGSSTPSFLQGSTGYGGSPQPQGTAGQFAPGSSPYTSVSLSAPQAGPSTTVQSSRKQFTSTFTGSSGAQAGSSTPSFLQGSTGYGGSPQPQDTASQFAPGSSPYTSVSLSAPQAGPSTTVQSSRKQFTSTFTGSSGAQAGSSTPSFLQGSTGYGGSPQPQDTASQFAPGSSPYASVSLSMPQAVAGPTAVQVSQKQFTSTFTGSSGAQAGSSTPSFLQGSTGYGGSPQPQDTASQFAPGSSPYTSVSLSAPQAGPSTTVQSSRKQFTSTFTGSSGAQAGSSTPSFLQGSTGYGGSPQPQDTASQFAPGSSPYTSVSLSAPQAGPSTTVQSSRKQFTSTFTGSSGAQAGSSTPSFLQGSTGYGGSPQPQDTASQFAPGSSPYTSVSLSAPQAGPSTTVQSSRKQFTSTFTGSSGAQAGSSTPSFLQGSTGYGGSPQPQDTASQFAPGSSPYTSVSLSALQAGPSTTVQSSRKQFTSTFTGSSGAQAGSSTPSFLQGSTGYGGSPQPQDTASQFAPGSSPYTSVSLSAPQAGPSTTVQSSRKQFTSTFTGSSGAQAGFSTPSFLQGSTGYGGSLQPQGTASQFAPGSPSSYSGLSLPLSEGVAGLSSSQKLFISTSQGSSGSRFGASAGFASGVSSRYSGSVQSQDTTSQFAPGTQSSYTRVSLSSPQTGLSSTVQGSQKRLSSTFIGSSGTQAGSSTPLVLQGSTGYGGSPQSQGTAGQFAPGSSPYTSVSLSAPQAGPSTTVQSSRKQFTSTFTGSSGTQAGSSTPLVLQGSTGYDGSPQPQNTASQFAPGLSSPYASVSLSSPQGSASQSSYEYQGYSGSRSQKTSATHWTRGLQISNAAASQASTSSQSSPVQFSFLSSAGGLTSGVSRQFASAPGGSTSYVTEALRLERAKYTPGSQPLPYDPSVTSQDGSSASASEVLSSYSSVQNKNAQPSHSSSFSRFYSVRG